MQLKYKTLIFTLMLAIFGTVNTFAVTSDFTDTDEHFAESYIDTLWELGVMKGTNSMANTESPITRGEFSALTARAFLNYDQTHNEQIFPDIPKNHLFFNEITALYKKGVITGRENGKFDPDATITRGEIALVLSKLDNINFNKTGNISFTDIPKNSVYYEPVKKLTSISVISGYSDNTFKPFRNATRAESAKMIALTLENVNIKADKSILKQTALDFVRNKYKGTATSDIIGIAKEHTDYKSTVNNYIKSQGGEVTKTISNLKADSVTTRGSLGEVICTYEITFNVNGNINTYNAKTLIKLVTNHNGTQIYYFNDNFKEKQKINLTWFVSESLPKHELTGVTHISPPVFQASKESLGVASDYIGSDKIRLYTAIAKKLMDYANGQNFKIWPIYKTDFTLATAEQLLNSESIQTNIINSIIRHSITNGFDGINIDFENVYKRDKGKLTNHIEKLTLALHELGMIVSCDVTRYEKTSANWSMCYDRDAISLKSDYIMLMAYDQYYASSPTAGPVSGLGWAEDSITKTLKEVPPENLVLGIPFYTRYWETRYGKVVSTKALSMSSAKKLANDNNAKYEYDSTNSLTRAYWYNSSGNLCTYWVENAESIQKRVHLANKYNLAGVASWRQGFETEDIWGAINTLMNNE